MTPDRINGVFEFFGSLFTWMNAYHVWEARGFAGISIPAVLLFMSWGLWNLFYYPNLQQWWSFAGGVSLVIANIVWVSLMMRYGKLWR